MVSFVKVVEHTDRVNAPLFISGIQMFVEHKCALKMDLYLYLYMCCFIRIDFIPFNPFVFVGKFSHSESRNVFTWEIIGRFIMSFNA